MSLLGSKAEVTPAYFDVCSSPSKQTFSGDYCTAGSGQPSLDLGVYKQTLILEMWQRYQKSATFSHAKLL